jgi:surface antigen
MAGLFSRLGRGRSPAAIDNICHPSTKKVKLHLGVDMPKGATMDYRNRIVCQIGIIALLSTVLIGCGGVHGGQSRGNVNQVGGGLIGGVAGGILGSQIGGGSGKVAAIIGGTLAGAALGSYVGGYMDRADQQRMSHSLENQPTGQTTTWRNPDTGHHYQVTPVRTYQTSEGRYCREFTTKVKIGGRMEDAYGTACRMPDGSWQIQDSNSGEGSYAGDQQAVHQGDRLVYVGPRGYCPDHMRIPPGHLPPPGLCRIWYPNHPPGQQPPPGDCATLSWHVPPGACLISR